MTYGAFELDAGQVFTPNPTYRNNEKLERLGYFARLTDDMNPMQCGVCGQWYVSDAARLSHGRMRHKTIALTPQQEEAMEDRLEHQLEETAPLYLEKTTASLR